MATAQNTVRSVNTCTSAVVILTLQSDGYNTSLWYLLGVNERIPSSASYDKKEEPFLRQSTCCQAQQKKKNYPNKQAKHYMFQHSEASDYAIYIIRMHCDQFRPDEMTE